MKLTVSKSFDTRVEKSERVLEVAEAFGLGLTSKKFVVYENLELEVLPKDVVYIEGQSGSGKSLLLRDLADQMRVNGLKVYDIADVPLLDVPLVDQIGRTTEEALKLLSQAGLNDAYLFVRRPNELSDGQKYRFRLAKLIESGAEVWIADEFAAVLDRDTAKVVAHNIAKTARQQGAILVVATTHNDLREYLGASVTVEKLYGTRVDVRRFAWSKEDERIELPAKVPSVEPAAVQRVPKPRKPRKPSVARKPRAPKGHPVPAPG
jgi:ABC-type ATPase with predicted acetyltransferase domain